MTRAWIHAVCARAVVVVAIGAAALAGPAAAQAAPQWWPSEPLPGGALDGVQTTSVGPDGTGLIFMYDHSHGYDQLLVRPVGGPPGAPQTLPSPIGATGGAPVVSWFPDASALIIDPTAGGVAFRSAGAAGVIGTPQQLYPGQGEGPAAVATAPDGSALVGLQGNLGAGVAYRSPGASGSVDTQHAQFFDTGAAQPNQDRVIGVALDPTGGAVVVWYDGANGTYYQSVRAPGASSFGNSTPIVTNPFGLSFTSADSGNAVLTWGGANGSSGYPTQVFASLRAPGGGFGNAVQIGSVPTSGGNPVYPIPAITRTGDAVVAWDNQYATSHSGTWQSAVTLGGVTTTGLDGVTASGNNVMLGWHSNAVGYGCPSCQPYVQLGSSGPSGFTFSSPVATPGAAATRGAVTPGASTPFAVGASGSALYVYEVANPNGSFQSWRLFPYEDRSNLGSGGNGGGGGGGGSGGNGGGGGSGGNGGSGGGGHVTPIVPRKLIVLAPLTGTHPLVVATCPPQVADECAFRLSVFAAFGTVPHASADRAGRRHAGKRAPLFGTAQLVLRPGHKGVLRIKLTAAGRRALAGGKRIHVRLVLQVRYDGKTHSLVLVTTLGPPRHKRRR